MVTVHRCPKPCLALALALLGPVLCRPDAAAQGISLKTEFTGPLGSGQPNLFATSDGRVLLTWHERGSRGSYDLKVAERSAKGAWSAPKTIASGNPFFVNWADFPSLVELADGSWLVHWLQKSAASTYAYHVFTAFSRDRGATWTAPIVPHRDESPTEHGFVSLVAWGNGAALAWLDGREMSSQAGEGGSMTLRFTTLESDGTLGEEVLLDDRTCECCQTAMARTRRGLVVAYRDRSADEIRDIAVVRLVDGKWTAPRKVAEDNWRFPACPVNGPSVAARGDSVALAWFTGSGGEPKVYLAFSTDGGANFERPIRLDQGNPLGRVDLDWLPDGSALVSWLESAGERADIRARRVSLRGRADRPVTVASSSEARSSGFPRLAVAGDRVIFAWTAVGESGGVRVASVEIAQFLNSRR